MTDFGGWATFVGGATLVDAGGILILLSIITSELVKTHMVISAGLYYSYMQVAPFAMGVGLIFGVSLGIIFMFGGGMWMILDKLLE